MVCRSAASAFAPRAFVFPGGTVDADDRRSEHRALIFGADDEWLAREFRAEDGEQLVPDVDRTAPSERLPLLLAAARELYEEAGVAVVCDGGGSSATLDCTEEAYFYEAIRKAGVLVDARRFARFSQWVTPPSEPRRYDAHFFVAIARANAYARADARETNDGMWVRPAEALQRRREGTFHMVFPTIKHVERLAQFDSVEHLFQYARQKRIVRVMPEDDDPVDRFRLVPALEGRW